MLPTDLVCTSRNTATYDYYDFDYASYDFSVLCNYSFANKTKLQQRINRNNTFDRYLKNAKSQKVLKAHPKV